MMKLRELRLADFKGVRSATYSFNRITRVLGQNGSGKTTVANAWYWLWADKDYGLRSNPNIRPNDVEECVPKVEAVLDIDGTEITIAKMQKRTVSKPNARGVSKVALTNTYEINNVPKTERDFKVYLEERGIQFELFLPLSHPDVFTGQKATDMRKALFAMAESRTDREVAAVTEGCEDLVSLLEQYKTEEVEAMNKASKKKAEQQLAAIPNQIIGLEKAKVDVDEAELELQRNILQEQLAEVEQQECDNEKTYEAVAKIQSDIMQTKFDIGDVERRANESLMQKRKEARGIYDAASEEANILFEKKKKAEANLERAKATVETKKAERNLKLKEFYSVQSETLPEDAVICPTCGQKLPTERAQEIIEGFENGKKVRLGQITKEGQAICAERDKSVEEIPKIEAEIEQLRGAWNAKTSESGKAYQELHSLPESVDLTGNQEYVALQKKLYALQSQLNKMDTGDALKQELRTRKSNIRADLDKVNQWLAKASNNVDIDEQITALQEKQRDYEQSKADAERILYELSLLAEAKNELLVGEINSHFRIVKWVLFDHQKNGEYKECCIPAVDERRFGDSTNTGREIIIKLDICNSLQRFYGMNIPVFLDGAEAINDWRIPEMNCQLITMKVTADKELKIEMEE